MSGPVATIRKSAREELRVSVDEFRGHELINLRVWFEGEDGEIRPGKQGVALWIELLPELIAVLHRADTALRGGGRA